MPMPIWGAALTLTGLQQGMENPGFPASSSPTLKLSFPILLTQDPLYTDP